MTTEPFCNGYHEITVPFPSFVLAADADRASLFYLAVLNGGHPRPADAEVVSRAAVKEIAGGIAVYGVFAIRGSRTLPKPEKPVVTKATPYRVRVLAAHHEVITRPAIQRVTSEPSAVNW